MEDEFGEEFDDELEGFSSIVCVEAPLINQFIHQFSLHIL